MKTLRASWKRVIKIGGVILLLLMVMDLNSRMVQMYSLQGEMEAELSRVQELEAIEAQLDKQIVYASSDDIVAGWARAHNWMQKEGDFLVALLPSGERPPEPLTESFRAEMDLDNWDAWMLWLSYRE